MTGAVVSCWDERWRAMAVHYLNVVSSVWLEYPELERTCRLPDSWPLLLDLRGWNCFLVSTGDVSEELLLSLPVQERKGFALAPSRVGSPAAGVLCGTAYLARG